MERDKPIYIADTLHNTIQISRLEKKVISTQLFNRLHNISQNSTAYLTFPTNRTKRFEHSVGTMKLCGEILYYSVNNGSEELLDAFFTDLRKSLYKFFIEEDLDKYRAYLDDEILEDLDKYEDYKVRGNFYNSVIPYNVYAKNAFLYAALFQGVRLAALLHDVGHPPFSHISEKAIKKVFDEYKDNEDLNARQSCFVDIIKEYCKEINVDGQNKESQLHEELGNKMVERIFRNLMDNEKDEGKDIKYFNILSFYLANYILTEKDALFKQIHSLIDGAMDGDRLDYVSRDVINSGFESGRIEYSRIISAMCLCKYKENYMFAPDVKVLNTAEDFFYRRWKLYKNIVFHHRVIKTDHLLEDSIYRIIKAYLGENKKELAPKEVLALPNDISGLWKPLKLRNSYQKYFDALGQWDDGWLLSMLKHYYFLNEYNEKTMLSIELRELLSNRKEFYSIIKDGKDFKKLDSVVIENMRTNFQILIDKAEKGSVYSELLKNIQKSGDKKQGSKGGYALSHIKIFVEAFFKEQYNFNDLIEQMIKDLIKEKYEETVKHFFTEFKEPNFGLSKTPYIYNNGAVDILNNLSNIGEILSYDGTNFPVFFLYITHEKEFDYATFVNDLGVAIGGQWDGFFKSIE